MIRPLFRSYHIIYIMSRNFRTCADASSDCNSAVRCLSSSLALISCTLSSLSSHTRRSARCWASLATGGRDSCCSSLASCVFSPAFSCQSTGNQHSSRGWDLKLTCSKASWTSNCFSKVWIFCFNSTFSDSTWNMRNNMLSIILKKSTAIANFTLSISGWSSMINFRLAFSALNYKTEL